MKKYYDIETGETITEEQLLTEYKEAVKRGEIDENEKPFPWYIHDCLTVFGGTLERVD